ESGSVAVWMGVVTVIPASCSTAAMSPGRPRSVKVDREGLTEAAEVTENLSVGVSPRRSPPAGGIAEAEPAMARHVHRAGPGQDQPAANQSTRAPLRSR